MTFAFDHIGLSVGDLDAQRGFYSKALGLDEEVAHAEMPGAQIRTALLRGPTGLQIELVERAGSKAQSFADPLERAETQGFFHLAVTVDDLEVRFAEALAAGAGAVSAPADAMRPGVRYAYLKDPEGNLLELTEHVSRSHRSRTRGASDYQDLSSAG
jgi:catechol 2,3-dioxygenase-like lactoylglutathione lyase family enzyme